MTKKGSKKRGKRKFTLPIAPIVGLVPMFARTASNVMAGKMDAAIDSLAYDTMGIGGVREGRPYFDFKKFAGNMTPLVLGILVHKFVGGAPLNVNKMLADANVPFIRI